MKKIRIIAIFFLLLLYLNFSDVYAYTIETLDKSADLQEISNKEHEILNWAEGFWEGENRKTDYEIDYSRAVKIYVDTNIFANKKLTPEILHNTLKNAVYIWEVPVRVSEDRYVIVTLSRALPIDEAMQEKLLRDGTYTEEELKTALAEVGNWTIPTASYDETQPDYIGKLNLVLGENLNQNEESKSVYLLGGTPKMRLPFGVFWEDGEYQIATLNTTAHENNTKKHHSDRQDLSNNSIYTFEQMKKMVSSIPKVNDSLDSGAAEGPEEIKSTNQVDVNYPQVT